LLSAPFFKPMNTAFRMYIDKAHWEAKKYIS